MIRLFAARVVMRDSPPAAGAVVAWWVSLVALVGATASVVAGLGGIPLMGVLLAAGVTFLSVTAMRWCVPTIAVSIIGVALGVASLFVTLAVTSGFEGELVRRLARLNGHVMITKYGLDFAEYDRIADRVLDDYPEVTAASPFAWGSAALVRDVTEREIEEGRAGEPAVIAIKGLDPQRAAKLEGLRECMQGGDLAALRPADPGVEPGAVVGHRLARRLSVEVGDHITLVAPAALDGTQSAMDRPPKQASFEVTDLLETGVAELDERLVMLHLTAAQALLFRKGRVTGIELALDDPRRAPAMARTLEADLNANRPLELYRTSTWMDANAGVLSVIRQVRAVVSLVLGLLIVVAAASLISSLLLLVRRKRAQIAILSAMGATRWTLFLAFETVGVLAGTLGAMAGLVFGGFYLFLLRQLDMPLEAEVYGIERLPLEVHALDALAPAIVSVLACALVAGPVALAATRVRPVDDLRGA